MISCAKHGLSCWLATISKINWRTRKVLRKVRLGDVKERKQRCRFTSVFGFKWEGNKIFFVGKLLVDVVLYSGCSFFRIQKLLTTVFLSWASPNFSKFSSLNSGRIFFSDVWWIFLQMSWAVFTIFSLEIIS